MAATKLFHRRMLIRRSCFRRWMIYQVVPSWREEKALAVLASPYHGPCLTAVCNDDSDGECCLRLPIIPCCSTLHRVILRWPSSLPHCWRQLADCCVVSAVRCCVVILVPFSSRCSNVFCHCRRFRLCCVCGGLASVGGADGGNSVTARCH